MGTPERPDEEWSWLPDPLLGGGEEERGTA